MFLKKKFRLRFIVFGTVAIVYSFSLHVVHTIVIRTSCIQHNNIIDNHQYST